MVNTALAFALMNQNIKTILAVCVGMLVVLAGLELTNKFEWEFLPKASGIFLPATFETQARKKPASLSRPLTESRICIGPYHGISPDGRCVWSCGQNTEPDPTKKTPECTCKAGYYEIAKDSFNRRVCAAAK